MPLDDEGWNRLPGRCGFDPAREAERRDLLGATRRAVDETLTARQHALFVAIVLNDGSSQDGSNALAWRWPPCA